MGSVDLKEALHTKHPLRFGKDGKFRILMVSDIHGGVGYDEMRTVRAFQALVDHTKPNLVLLGGDIAGPGTIHVSNEAELRQLLDGITAPMEQAGIPWAHVYGNHDDNFGLADADQQPVYESYPHCVSKGSPEGVSGVSNYVLPVWDEKGETILFNVFALDSQHRMDEFRVEFGLSKDVEPVDLVGMENEDESPIRFSQVAWYYQTSQALEAYAGHRIPALMYTHFPLPEHRIVARRPEECLLEGHVGTQIDCSYLNSGLFSACLQRGDVKAIFSGHDHRCDYSGVYCGIRLGFDGYLSYCACHVEELRGGRLFEISADAPDVIQTKMVRIMDILEPENP